MDPQECRVGLRLLGIHDRNLENCQRVPSVTLAGDICRAYQFDRETTIALMSEAVRNAGKDKPGKRNVAAKASASNQGKE